MGWPEHDRQTDSNLVILTLPYSFLVDSSQWAYQTNTGLWHDHYAWSHSLFPHSILSQHQLDSIRVIDNAGALRDTVLALNYNGVCDANHVKLIEPQFNNQLITFSICGNERFVNNCRAEILRSYVRVGYVRISLSAAGFGAMGAKFLLKLHCIASRHAIEVVIGACDTDFCSTVRTCTTPYLYLLGAMERARVAETDIRVLVDALLDGCYVDRVAVPLSMVPTLGGVEMVNFAELARETRVRVYLPCIVPAPNEALPRTDDVSIWVSSKHASEVLLSTQILSDLSSAALPAHNSDARLYTQETRVSKEKMDLLSVYHRAELVAIMLGHGTYIHVPTLGDLHDNTVVVQAATLDALQNTLSDFAALCARFYTLDVQLRRAASVPADWEYYLLRLVSQKRSCLVSFNEHGLHVVGGKCEIGSLLAELTADLSHNALFSQFVQCTDFRALVALELACDQRDFVSGKKNGKISKILQQVDQLAEIGFEPFNDLNFVIRLSVFHSARDGAGALKLVVLAQTLLLMELELPVEQKFHIPDAFHQSIIGYGGQVIQVIMKKYNVFVKLVSHTQDAAAALRVRTQMLYSLQRSDNVIVKCPTKNAQNIARARSELDLLVRQCCHNSIMTSHGISVVYNTVRFRLLRSHYQLLIRRHRYSLDFVSVLERDHGAYIEFPRSLETFNGAASIDITITGNHTKARHCAMALRTLLPHTRELLVAYLPARFRAVVAKELPFRDRVTIPFRLVLDTEMVVFPALQTRGGTCHAISLSAYASANLPEATRQLTHYIVSNGLTIQEERSLEENPIIAIEEHALPKKLAGRLPLKTALSVQSVQSIESALNGSARRHSPQFTSPSPIDEAQLAPVSCGVLVSSHKGRSPSLGPLQPITNQNFVSNNAKMGFAYGLPNAQGMRL